MIISSLLKIEKEQLEDQIDEYYRKINTVQNSYDSLCSFRRSVQLVQESFASASKLKEERLSAIQSTCTNCAIAMEYSKDMSEVMRNVGSKAVGAAYPILISWSGRLLSEYQEKIEDYNDRISYLRWAISRIDEQIRELGG